MTSATRLASAVAAAFQSLTFPISASRVSLRDIYVSMHAPRCIPLLSDVAPISVASARTGFWASRSYSSAADAGSTTAECTDGNIAQNNSHDTAAGRDSQQLPDGAPRSVNSSVEAEQNQSPATNISNSDRHSDAHQSQQQQQHATEQLLSELFDSELQQRLMKAAAAVRQQASSNNISSSTSAPYVPQPRLLQQPTSAEAQIQVTQQQQQQQQQRFQPGVLPTAPLAYQPPHSSSSSRPSHVSSWHPSYRSAAAADPWAPIPGPELARSQLSARLLHLLQQAGVSQHTATAAVTAAAVPDPQISGSNITANQQQQQQRRSSTYDTIRKVLQRLPTQQLLHLLEDCQAPTYGSKDLLIDRVLLLLEEQALQQQQQQQQQQVGSRLDHQRSVWSVGQAELESSGVQVQDQSSLRQQQQQQQQQLHQSQQQQLAQMQQQQRHANGHQQVAAAAAARQQLLDLVVDVGEIGGWLMAARAQDVCVIDARGQTGLCEQIVIGSGLSQRHAHACAEAVAWQIREKAKQAVQRSQQQQQQKEEEGQTLGTQILYQQQLVNTHSSLNDLLSSVSVLGDASSDWALLDTGKVAVHVLTERARRFYNLEGLWGGTQESSIKWMVQEDGVETKETIGRDMHA